MTQADIRQLVRDRLSGCPDVHFDDGPDWIKVPPSDPSGFEVGVWADPKGYTVAFDGWHEELSSAQDALDCIAFGLSQSCRLAVALRGNYATTWTVEALEDDTWTPLSVTGLFMQPFWRRVRIEYRSNRLFDVRTPAEVARFRQIVGRGHDSGQ